MVSVRQARSRRGRDQHRDGRVEDDDDHQPADSAEVQRLHDVGGDAARPACRRSPGRARAQAVGALADEPQAADRHQERARAHHDRERRRRVHPEQADQDHARRVEADAERHQRAEQEVAGDGDRRAARRARRAHRRRAAGCGSRSRLHLSDQHQRGGDQQRRAHADLHPRFDQLRTTPAPSQAPSTAAAIIAKSVSTSTGMTDV